MPGNPTITDFTRVNIRYVDDQGVEHRIPQRRACQVGVGNVLSTNVAAPPRPSKWKLRHVQLKYDSGTHVFRKRVVVGLTTQNVWGPTPANVPIDGQSWTVEGRIGEKRQVSA